MVFSLQPTSKTLHCWQDELDSAIKSVKSKKRVLVLGSEKIGKSSFLLELSGQLKESKFLPFVFSASYVRDLSSYIKKNFRSILTSYSYIIGATASDLFSRSMMDIDKLLAELKLGVETKDAIKLLLFFEHDSNIDLADVVKTLFNLPQLLAKEAKKDAVLLVDDIENFSGVKSEKVSLSIFFDMMNSNLAEVPLVLASSQRLALEGLDEIVLKPFTLDIARKFFADNKLELNEQSITAIYNITGGIPFYLNYVARMVSVSGVNTAEGVNAVVDSALSNELHAYYSEKLKLLSPKELPILFCMAEHRVNTPSRISKLLNYSQTNVRRFLSIMEEKGFVTLQERGVFEIHDPVFRLWLEIQSRQ